jgi:transcriptional antiterminator RfaH
MLQWYALGVKPNRERKVVQALDDMLIYAYVPRCTVKNVQNGKVVQRKMLLFPGYVFVKLDLDKPGWQSARYVKGATCLLPRDKPTPAPIPATFIDGMRKAVSTDELTIDECWERVKGYVPGDTVRVIDGLLIEQEGKFVAYQAGFVTLIFSLLGKQKPVEVPAQHVAPAPETRAASPLRAPSAVR